jgi:K+-sensing histidine kinase KdpD
VLLNDVHFTNVVNVLDNNKYSPNPIIDVYTENVKTLLLLKSKMEQEWVKLRKKNFWKILQNIRIDIHNVERTRLGIVVCKRIIEDHNGQITVK